MTKSEERAAAKSCGLTRYHTDYPCIKCHSEIRYARSGQCVVCAAGHKFLAKLRHAGIAPTNEDR